MKRRTVTRPVVPIFSSSVVPPLPPPPPPTARMDPPPATVYVTQNVYVPNSQQPTQKRPNHVLHLILTILTFGLWLPVWIVVALS